MSSSPSSAKKRSPKRASPNRTPLREQTQSQANEISSRLSKDARSPDILSVYNTTPFPTKPAHILLPSSIKKKRSDSSPATDIYGFSFDGDTGRSNETQQSPRGGTKPAVRLKRSVKALRDLYEAQAEEISCTSAATSPRLRPSTAGSSRLRSVGSAESLSGAFAWESLRKISSDDLAALPTLPPGGRYAKRLSFSSSPTPIIENVAATSSPNYRVLDATSSPSPPGFQTPSSPVGEPFEDILTTDSAHDSSSSPNLVRLAHTSSTEHFQGNEQSSSPNVIKLGTYSPFAARPPYSVHMAVTRSSSTSSSGSPGKRKRSDTFEGRTFAARLGARNPLASSPPVDRYVPTSGAISIVSSLDRGIPSSAPQSMRQISGSIDDSSPVVRLLGRDGPNSDDSSLAETHSSLQAALSSSPPRIQYPVVRAPPPSQQAQLIVPKRNSRSISTDNASSNFFPRLSVVPSESSWRRARPTSVASSAPDDLDEYLNSEELAPASAYIINASANQTQIRLVQDADSEFREASDEVSALPSSEHVYRSPALRASRSGSYIGSSNTSQSRLNSLKSFTLSRQNSFLSTSLRPSSSGSTASNVVLPLPTWAQRYYSGVYRDSFQYLSATGSHMNMASASAGQLALATPSRPATSKSNKSHSRSVHQVMTDRIGAFFRSKSRPRVEARKSHSLPGVGPLVSNPVREPATAALEARRQSYPPQHGSNHLRSSSAPFSPADPRAHWAGIVEIREQPTQDGRGPNYIVHHHHLRATSFGYSVSRTESRSESVIHYPTQNYHRWSFSPHLHHDNRLNTGSSASRGFGFPFNTKSRWTAPSVLDEAGRPLSRVNLRTLQVVFFTAGFLIPITWFVSAFLPLPKRPVPYTDLEKQVHAQSMTIQRGSQGFLASDPPRLSDWDNLDVMSQLRMDRHLAGVAELQWQNARWWRNLNRWMCAVGLVVCVIIIVLSVLGTKGHL